MTGVENAIASCPLVAILRGLLPENAESVGQVLYQSGLRVLEVPINSPRPFQSIEILRQTLPEDCIVGAGTLRTLDNLRDLQAVGGQIAVMPHTNRELIRSAIELELIPMPGVFTPSEVFAALDAGATHLKLFPANVIGQALVKAVRAVLPEGTRLYAVGGVDAESLRQWMLVDGFGVGSSIFRPTDSLEQIQEKAVRLVAATQMWKRGG